MPPANSANEELLCRSVWSKRSGVTSSDQAVSRCRLGEEMMSCSSYTLMVSMLEKPSLRAAGRWSVLPLMLWGGKCQVHASPECVATQHHLTGCTLWSAAGISAESRPHGSDRRHCVVSSGATSHAVCCHAPSLECHLLEKISADKDQVEVSCPSGWTLTDCSAVSPGSVVLAPVAKGNSCHVASTSGAGGAAGVAVCCRVRQPEQRRASPPP
ncbi:Proprotein convertase subtilisin/kexin type 9 [Dissostichus eleginoides]|uniref:Proprotein convertase subtilisin/kexin type 9 n=1 Tax=Dissostichus eleginoides TaxID=100907 RepID=A0AAD9C822_DISEL|nr:Proprotein convertase subtilisin/kexin type 9 [Dissostichus eleginoides]